MLRCVYECALCRFGTVSLALSVGVSVCEILYTFQYSVFVATFNELELNRTKNSSSISYSYELIATRTQQRISKETNN